MKYLEGRTGAKEIVRLTQSSFKTAASRLQHGRGGGHRALKTVRIFGGYTRRSYRGGRRGAAVVGGIAQEQAIVTDLQRH